MRGDITSGPVKVHGIEATMRKLASLDQKARRRIVTKAVRAGAKEQRKAGKAEAPVDKGWLRKQLRTSVKRDQRKGTVTARLRLKTTKAQGGKGMRSRREILHLIVGGTAPHRIPGPLAIGNSGRVVSEVDHPGTSPNPFLERAATRSQQAAIHGFTRTFATAFEAEARKGAS